MIVELVELPRFIRQRLELVPVAVAPWRGRTRGVAAPEIIVIPWEWAKSRMGVQVWSRAYRSVLLKGRVCGHVPIEGASVWSDGGYILSTDLSRQTWPDELV